MKTQKWKITGPVAVRGHLPGEEFHVQVHDNGVPVDAYWRKRKAEELSKKRGDISFPSDEKPAPVDKPPAEKTSTEKTPPKSK